MTAPVHLRIVESAQHADPTEHPEPTSDDRLVIHLEDGHIAENLDQIGAALARTPDIFVWAGRLVRLHRCERPSKTAALRRPEGSVVLVPIDGAHLVELIGRSAVLTKFDGRSGMPKLADCPRRIADAYLSRLHYPEHKRLTGIVESATITPDNRLLDRPGFDAMSGIFVACDPAELPGWEPIPEHPDAEDAKAAVDVLLDAIASWPFVEEADRSAAIAALISTLIRRSLSAAPMVAISATAAGSGKSLLADWNAILATGRRPAVMIPLAYQAAGSPAVDLPPLGSFGEWDRMVRRPLRWLGLPDPLAPAETLREFDPELESARLLLSAWQAVFSSKPIPATEVISAALDTAPMSGEYVNPELREALQMICHEKITARRLGGWLRSNRDRIVDGRRAVQCGLDGKTKIARWAVRND